jgi:hypothetical protein
MSKIGTVVFVLCLVVGNTVLGYQYGLATGKGIGKKEGEDTVINAFHKHCDPFSTLQFPGDNRLFACGLVPDNKPKKRLNDKT